MRTVMPCGMRAHHQCSSELSRPREPGSSMEPQVRSRAALGCLQVLYFVLPHPTSAAACDSRSDAGIAILSIQGANGPTLDLHSATECAARCCGHQGCSGWSFTPLTRSECPDYGCCFLKMGSQAEINNHTHNMYNSTAGCIGFTCSKPTNSPSPQPGGRHPPAPAPPPAPPVPFAYVTPFF